MSDIEEAVLGYLFDAYEKSGGHIVNANPLVVSMNGDIKAVAKSLSTKGYIKSNQVGRGCICTITTIGVNYVAPTYFQEEAQKVLDHAKSNGGSTTIFAALAISDHFGKGRDIADYIENHKLATVQKIRDDANIYLF